MYFDFEDGHPEIPRVPSALTLREGVLLSIIVHLLAILAIVIVPKTQWWQARQAAIREAEARRQELLRQQRPQEQTRFVFVQPRVEMPPQRPPNPRAPLADRDRSAMHRERAPVPTNPQPFSRGNTSDFVEPSPPPQQMARQQSPAPPAPPAPPGDAGRQSDEQALRLPESPTRPTFRREDQGRPLAGSSPLGRALQNLSRYAEQAALENPSGGQGGTFGPAIQFDTKGVEFGPWIRRFVAQVKRNWFIPYAAMSLKGRVVITFNVHKNGALTDLTIVGPSDVESFNNAAYNALAASNPTEPLPPEYPADKAFFTVTFYYNEPVPAQ
ncbi:MAG TPA: TonB family protein [Vicinamibacterales bacterium]